MVLPTVLLPVQQMCCCVLGESVVILHARECVCVCVRMCVRICFYYFYYIEFIHHVQHLWEHKRLFLLVSAALQVLWFFLFITYWSRRKAEARIVNDKLETYQTSADLQDFFFFFFNSSKRHVKDAFECQTCVTHVQCDASSWDALFLSIPSCTHLFHPCTDVVAAFTQPWWNFAKCKKRPSALNCLWWFCVGHHATGRMKQVCKSWNGQFLSQRCDLYKRHKHWLTFLLPMCLEEMCWLFKRALKLMCFVAVVHFSGLCKMLGQTQIFSKQ